MWVLPLISGFGCLGLGLRRGWRGLRVLEQVDKRLNHIEVDVKDLRADLRSLDAKIDRNLKWTLGILIPMWITIILTIVFK